MSKIDRGIPSLPDNKEEEPRSKVTATIYGFAHHPLNLDANKRIVTEVESLLGQTRGNVFVLLEGSITPQEARTRSLRQREKGLWRTQVEHDMTVVFGKKPKDADVNIYMDQLRKATIQEILDYGLLPEDKIRINLLIRDLDDLMQRDPRLKVRDETQSQGVLDSIQADRDRYRSIERGFDVLWESGNFDNCQAAMNEIFQKVSPSRKARDKGIVRDNLKPILEGQMKDPRGGAALAVVGANHIDGIATGIKWAFGKRVNTEPILDLPLTYPQLRTKELVANGQPIPSELLAQATFESVAIGELSEAFLDWGIIDIFANNFNLIHEAISDIVSVTPEGKIRELCEGHGNIIEYLEGDLSFERITALLPEYDQNS